ncbi:MAG TPA: hypothetical protein VNO22_04675 [Planctomycetota bacterium]|nr:hypothetical protein [Planctomycetota bacterium]
MRQVGIGCLVFGAAVAFAAPQAGQEVRRKGRFEGYTERASRGPKMKPVAATYLGGPSDEEFFAVRVLGDGTIVAFGNAWGPSFPVPAVVWGRGEHRGLKAFGTDSRGRPFLRPENPDIAGMVALYAPDASHLRKVFRFDWGVASLSAATVSSDGRAFLLAGRATAAFRAVPPTVRTVPPASEPPGKNASRTTGPYEYEGVSCPGDVFICRMSLEGKAEWAWVFEGAGRPPEEIWTDREGFVYADVRGLIQVAPGGSSWKRLSEMAGGGQARWLAVDPDDGSAYFGGDRNTHTGKEPWRQPYLYKFDREGRRVWKLWEWAPRSLRDGVTPGLQGLVADSSVRALDRGPDGDLYVGGWSDGGNSVFARQPTDAARGVPPAPWSMDGSGMKGANSLAHIVRIDGSSLEAKSHVLWVAYFPADFSDARKAGSPNGARIRQIQVCPDGAVAVAGSAASVLVQTPGAFYRYPGGGRGYGGECVVVYDAGFENLLFSSYLPGYENARLWPTGRGIVVVGRTKGRDDEPEATPTPVLNAIQKEPGGGRDAHLLLLEKP